jgi:hypothetical protein
MEQREVGRLGEWRSGAAGSWIWPRWALPAAAAALPRRGVLSLGSIVQGTSIIRMAATPRSTCRVRAGGACAILLVIVMYWDAFMY